MTRIRILYKCSDMIFLKYWIKYVNTSKNIEKRKISTVKLHSVEPNTFIIYKNLANASFELTTLFLFIFSFVFPF